jgi:hypothetical protein
MWSSYDTLVEHEEQWCRQLVTVACQLEVAKRFTALPGISWIRAATLYAYLDTPWRFRSKAALWIYLGIGLERQQEPQLTEYTDRKDAKKRNGIGCVPFFPLIARNTVAGIIVRVAPGDAQPRSSEPWLASAELIHDTFQSLLIVVEILLRQCLSRQIRVSFVRWIWKRPFDLLEDEWHSHEKHWPKLIISKLRRGSYIIIPYVHSGSDSTFGERALRLWYWNIRYRLTTTIAEVGYVSVERPQNVQPGLGA